MTKHAFPAYNFCKQNRYLCRHLAKPRSMKPCSFISRLQELNTYLEEFPPDTDGQETAPLSADEIMDIIYQSMPATWKNKMIEQGFDYADSTVKEMSDFFETRVENLEPREDRKKSSSASKKPRKALKKRKREDSDSSVVESSKESTEARRPIRKYCILHGKCSHSTDNCKDLHAMINKHKQKKKKPFKNYGKSNNELNALIDKKFQTFVKNKKRRKTEKELQHFQEMQISDDESKKSISSLAESVESGEISSSSSE